MKRLPFARTPKIEIVPVGQEEHGILYLQKRNSRTVSERTSLDEAELKQSKGQLILFKLARRIAEDKDISSEQALAQILAGNGTSPLLLDYLDEMHELLSLRGETDKLKDLVATILIKGRIAYPVVIGSNAKAGVEKLAIAPLSFPLADGDLIKFDSVKVEIKGNYEPGATELEICALGSNISSQKVGFLCNFESGNPRLGDPDWTLEDTGTLGEELIEDLYEFYQVEVNGGVRPTAASPEGNDNPSTNQSDNSKTLPQLNSSTGEKSTGESKDTELLTIASVA